MSPTELMNLRAVNRARGPAVFEVYADNGALWRVCQGLGEPWARVYAGYDYDKRTLPLLVGPGFTGRRHRPNPS